MSELDNLPAPEVHRHKRGRPSAVWIVPVLAIVAGGALAIRTYLRSGPTIHITFDTADGLEAGKSEVRYKNVPVGKVEGVEVTDDHQHIVATIKLDRGAAGLAVSDSKFWVERPRVGIGGVTGLSTLLSGAYIGVDVGSSTDTIKEFTGLEKPPGVTRDQHGRRFKLVTTDAGSLAVRSPVYLHRQQVGSISELELAADGRGIAIEIFVEDPYAKDVTDRSVFWNASGLDVTLDASGLRLETQSLATVVAGGIAFGLRDPQEPGTAAAENTKFTLFEDRGHALARPDTEQTKVGMRFRQPLRGVGVGTVIDLEGIRIGGITEVKPGYDETKHEFFTDLVGIAYPERLGDAYKTLTAEGVKLGKTGPQMLQGLVGRGLRAQIRSGNLITGQIYIGLVWMPNAPVVKVDDSDQLWAIPTEKGGTDQIQDEVASIVAKIDKIPFDAIGNDVHDTTRAATALLGHLDHDVVPDAKKLFAQADIAMGALRDGLTALRDNVAAPDSAIQQSTRTALEQVERAAFSLRSLSDYIQHHPESILRGRVGADARGGK